MSEQIITVVALAYCQPIADLVERMLEQPAGKVMAARLTHRENGYSLSIVLLLVVMLESLVGRVSDLQARKGTMGKVRARDLSVPDYLASLKSTFGLRKSLTEVFVLRDAIAHSHVWTLTVSDHEAHGLILCSANLSETYGSRKQARIVNPRTRRTSILGLNVVPSAVGRREVAKVFDVVWRTLDFLVRMRLLESTTIVYRGRYQKRPFDFWDLRHLTRSSASVGPRRIADSKVES